MAMSHDVFISYSSLDKLAADAVCHGLEAKGVRCWIAPRDQLAGRPYGEQITESIQAAQVMVLIFSDNVNNSHAVHNEVDLAAAANLTIVPFRITGVDFNPELRFYLGRVHWLDAFPQPVDHYIDDLAATVRRNLKQPASAEAPPPAGEPEAVEHLTSELHAAEATLAAVEAATVSAESTVGRPPPRAPMDKRLVIGGAIAAGVIGLVVIAAGVGQMMPKAAQSSSSAAADSGAAAGVSGAAASSASGASGAPAGSPAIVAVGPSNPAQVAYYETEVVANGPPAFLNGAMVLNTAQLEQGLNERAPGSNPLVDARGCTAEPTIPGAECLAPNTIQSFIARYPDKTANIAIFCHDGSCPWSYELASAAVAAGYQHIYWYRGGINAWMAAGLPTTHFNPGSNTAG
jgi:rhodanese-related sulfurtransferase